MDITQSVQSRPLEGLTVIEVGTVVLAPYAAQILADLGATVIKVEPPQGDATRQSGTRKNGGMGALFLNCNRGKQSLAVDLKRPEGLAILQKLVRSSDVLIHNMRSDAAKRLGIGYADLKVLNSRLVYCCTHGYGAGGRMAQRPAYDDVIQAACGLVAMRQRIDGQAAYAPTIIADKTTALFVVIGVMAALSKRERSGVGEEMEVAMFETMAHYLSIEHLDGCTFDPPVGTSGYKRLLTDFRRPHRTKDGFMAVLPYTAKQWEAFFAMAGRSDVLSDPRFCDEASRSLNVGPLYQEVGMILPQRTNAEWEQILLEIDIPHSRVNDMEDLISDGHLQDVGYWHKYDHPTEGMLVVPSFPVRFGGAAGSSAPQLSVPRLGEHTEALLHRLGYPPHTVEELKREKVVVA